MSVKRSFYQVLDVPPDASREQVDAAYTRAAAALEAGKHLRGPVESAIEWNLLQDGYQILCHPVRRARYDAKLAAERSSADVVLLPEVAPVRRKQRAPMMMLAAMTAVLGAFGYSQIAQRVDEVRIEHQQAVARKMEERGRAVTVDPARLNRPASVSRGNETIR